MARRNVAAALVLIALAIWYGVMAAALPARPMPNTPGPSFFPLLIAASLLLLALALLGQGLFALRARRQTALPLVAFSWRPAVALVLFAAYVAALPYAGFLAASIPFFASMMLLFGGRGWAVALASTGIPLVLFYLFRDGFQILLPRGGW